MWWESSQLQVVWAILFFFSLNYTDVKGYCKVKHLIFVCIFSCNFINKKKTNGFASLQKFTSSTIPNLKLKRAQEIVPISLTGVTDLQFTACSYFVFKQCCKIKTHISLANSSPHQMWSWGGQNISGNIKLCPGWHLLLGSSGLDIWKQSFFISGLCDNLKYSEIIWKSFKHFLYPRSYI